MSAKNLAPRGERCSIILSQVKLLTCLIGVVLASALQAQSLLLADNWWDDTVVALDPYDGHLIDETYIDPLRINPGEIADSGRGTLIASSDYSPDAIVEMGHDGTILKQITGGLETFFIEVYGDSVYSYSRNVGNLLKINMDSGEVSDFVTGLPTYGDAHFRSNDVLVGTGDKILRFDHQGNPLGMFHQAPDITTYGQINPDGNGGLIAVGQRTHQRDFIESYDAAGNLVNIWHADSATGAVRLGNGKILVTGLFSISVLDPATGGLTEVVGGLAFGHVNLVTVPEPSLLVLGGGLVLALLRRRR